MTKPTENNSTTSEAVVEEVKLTTAEIKAAYAVAKEEAKAVYEEAKALDPSIDKFKFPTQAEYKSAYLIKWDLDHPNDKDALVPSTDAVLAVVDDAIDATTTAVATVKQEGTVSKMALARAIFAEELAAKGVAGLVRKDILKRFQDEAGCKEKGANTYYNTCRNEHGLVVHKS